MYALKAAGIDRLEYKDSTLVPFSSSVKDPRGGNGGRKAAKLVNFLKSHQSETFFSTEIVKALKSSGVRSGDVMTNLRRYERKGLVYVRGYLSHDRQSPFKEGFLIAWIGDGVS